MLRHNITHNIINYLNLKPIMKTLNTLRKLKSAVLFSLMAFAIVGLSSCDKNEDIEPSSNQEIDSKIKTEFIIVEKNQWQTQKTNKSATLACTIIPTGLS